MITAKLFNRISSMFDYHTGGAEAIEEHGEPCPVANLRREDQIIVSRPKGNDRLRQFVESLPFDDMDEDIEPLLADIADLVEHHRAHKGKRRRTSALLEGSPSEAILLSHWNLIMDFIGLSPDLVQIMWVCKRWRQQSMPLIQSREVLLLLGNPRKFDVNQNVQYFDSLTRVWAPFLRFHPDWVRARIKAKLSAVYSKKHGLYIPSDHLKWSSAHLAWEPFRNVQCDNMVLIDHDVYSFQCCDYNFGPQDYYLEITKRSFDHEFTAIKVIQRGFDSVFMQPRSPQYQGAAILLPSCDGCSQIGFFGGAQFTSKTSCAIYNPTLDTWRDLPDLPIRVYNNTATYWRGFVVIAGGSRTRSRWSFNSKVWMLNLTAKVPKWKTVQEMPREHGHCMLATVNGDLVSLMSTSASKPAVLYRYCPITRVWIQVWSELNAGANSNVSKDGVLLSCPYSVLFPDRTPSNT